MNIVISDHDLHPDYQSASGMGADDHAFASVESYEDFLNMYDGCAFE